MMNPVHRPGAQSIGCLLSIRKLTNNFALLLSWYAKCHRRMSRVVSSVDVPFQPRCPWALIDVLWKLLPVKSLPCWVRFKRAFSLEMNISKKMSFCGYHRNVIPILEFMILDLLDRNPVRRCLHMHGQNNGIRNLIGTWTIYIYMIAQIAKIIGSTSIRYRSDAKVSDRCRIDGDPMVFAIWESTRFTSCCVRGECICIIWNHNNSWSLRGRNWFSFPNFNGCHM